MITKATIQAGIYSWGIAVLPSVPIIWSDDNGDRPSTTYISFKLPTIKGVGVDIELDTEVVGNRDFVLATQSFGSGAMDNLETLKMSLSKISNILLLRAVNIAIVSQGSVNDISMLLDSRWEERAQCDFNFRFAQIDSDDSGAIQHINIEKDFYRPDLSTITVENILVESGT
jgi:hypothetical protein